MGRKPSVRSFWLAIAVVVWALVLGGCREERPVERSVTPSAVGIIAEYTYDGRSLSLTLDDGRVLRFGPGAVQLTDQPPAVGLLLFAGEDDQGQWLMPVGGAQGVFVLHGTGFDEGRHVVVRPNPPSIGSGPPRLVRLVKAPDFFGGRYEERGIYDSPTGTFALDASGAVTGYQP